MQLGTVNFVKDYLKRLKKFAKFFIDLNVREPTQLVRCRSHIDTGAKSRFLASK